MLRFNSANPLVLQRPIALAPSLTKAGAHTVHNTEINFHLTTTAMKNNPKKKKNTSFCHHCPSLLAELVEDLLKHEDGASAAKDGERLAGKEGIDHTSHGCTQ